jgi:prepilin-type N-terminal cleavage/methylation domain-containing protein
MKHLKFNQNSGFTLIEVIASLVILVVSLTMLLSLVNQNLKATQEIKEDAISGFLGEMAISDLYLSSIFKDYKPPNLAEVFQENYEVTKGETDLCIPIETAVNYLKYSIGIGKKNSKPRDYYVICLTGEIEGW